MQSPSSDDPIDVQLSEQVRARLDDWREHLIDLTLRNRLINYKPTRASTLVVRHPSIEGLLSDPGRTKPFDFYFPPEPEDKAPFPGEGGATEAEGPEGEAPRPDAAGPPAEPLDADTIVTDAGDPKRLKRTLETLARRSNEEFAEKALRVLHLAVGFLEWNDPVKGDALRSPLVLVPITLNRRSVQDPYRLSFVEDEDILINPALTLKLEQSGLVLPAEWAWEDKPVMQELDEISSAVATHGWTVSPGAVIGLFSFQKLVMYMDLLKNEDKVLAHGSVRMLAARSSSPSAHETFGSVPHGSDLDQDQSPFSAFSILDADSSQRRCIEAAKRGCSLVMHGPPGTGKSQTIANIIAEALGEQKRVLFISEKIAALDVVYKRLNNKGLGDFCLKLHGRDAVKREVIASLHDSLTQRVTPRSTMTDAECERLVELRTRLNAAIELLHCQFGALLGRSPHEVYGLLAALEEAPSVGGAPAASSLQDAEARAELQRLLELERSLSRAWSVALDDEFAWRGYTGTTFTPEDRTRVVSALERGRRAASVLAQTTGAVAGALGVDCSASLRSARDLGCLGQSLVEAPPMSALWLDRTRLDDLLESVGSAHAAHRSQDLSRQEFVAAYPRSQLADFPTDIDAQLAATIATLESSIGWTDTWEAKLAPSLPDLTRFTAAADESFEKLERHGQALAEMLGQPWQRPSIEELSAMAKLANLAYEAKDRPDEQWLVPSGLSVARSALTSAPMFVAYQERSAAILEHYAPAVFDLDVDAILTRAELAAAKRLGRLSGGYRADMKLLKGLRSDHVIPPTLMEDLKEVSAVQKLGGELDESADQLRSAFGTWFDGRATDVEGIRRACDVAQEVIGLAASDCDLKALASHVAHGSLPDMQVAQQSAQVEASLSDIAGGIDMLTGLSARYTASSPTREKLEVLRAELARLVEPIAALAAVVGQLRDARISGSSFLTDIQRDAGLIAAAHRDDGLVERERTRWERGIGEQYAGSTTDWEALEAATKWLGGFFKVLPGDPTVQIVQRLTSPEPAWPAFGELQERTGEYEEAVDAITEMFGVEHAEALRVRFTEDAVGEVFARFDRLTAGVQRLPEWADYRAAAIKLEQVGWGDFLRRLREQRVPEHSLEQAVTRAYWQQRLVLVYDEHPTLQDFRGRSHEALIAEFRDLDRQLIGAATDRIIAVCNGERPEPIASPGSEVALLRHEAGKKRRHLPVRKLFERIPELLPALKPCLMMSPLTVSHYLSGDHQFDLVIFDEASQVPPWDAINCIYRGEQLVVAGDSKQLPPTAFFEVTGSDAEDQEDDEEAPEEMMESILDSCEAILPSESLRWHYRSRHESLIAFSNHNIYNNRLVTFPSPVRNSDRLGVHLINVPDGVYDRARSRTNRVEARRVAERVIEHLQSNPERSIGVVAFSSAQAEAILDALDGVRALHPEFESHFKEDRLNGIFVKNLETVQGDERDVMILSVGYGRDIHNKFAMQFGPLGKDAGHRRLNVAITRAREQVDVVTSVLASDFRVADQMKTGVRLLRDYIAFAEQGPSALAGALESLGGEYDSPLEESIADAIRGLGYEVVSQVGVGGYRIDLGVVDPATSGRFILGVECDGATYHSTPTARDRDRLRQEVLEDLGWTIYRVWSTDWIRERAVETERLDAAIKAARDAPGKGRPGYARADPVEVAEEPRVREELVVHDLQNGRDSELLPWVSVYERARLGSLRTGYEFHEPENAANLVHAIGTVVAAEGPIEIGLTISRVAEAHGITRRGSRVMGAGELAVAHAAGRGLIEEREAFLWRPGQAIGTVRRPDPADPTTRRSIDEVAPEEISLAITRLREASGRQDDDSLITQVARILGFDRTGTQIQSVLRGHLDELRRRDERSGLQ